MRVGRVVEFCTGNCPENTNVGTLSATTGAVRNSGGITDTDNNLNDFTIVTNPVPHNAASGPNATCQATPTSKSTAAISLPADTTGTLLVKRQRVDLAVTAVLTLSIFFTVIGLGAALWHISWVVTLFFLLALVGGLVLISRLLR